MVYNAFKIVRDFEDAVCEYTGAPLGVAVNSCTNALFLCLKYFAEKYPGTIVKIPKYTYLSVPMQIKHAGLKVEFTDEEWTGIYQLKPFPIYDSARYFTSDLYKNIFKLNVKSHKDFPFICCSFHWNKTLGIQQGGMILHGDVLADKWFRMARFDGRTEGVRPKDDNPILGWHCYLSPEIAAEGLVRLMHLPKDNPPMLNDDYPDLSKLEIFK